MKLHYKKIGDGDPLLILHGLFGSADNWGSLAKRFATNNTVYLVDLRNHGRSPHSNVMNYESMADDVYEMIINEKINQPILLGHSMGGKVSLKFTDKYPQVLKKLIVADIGIKSYPMHHDIIIKGLKNVDLSVVNSRSEATSALSFYIKEQGIQQFLLKNLYWIEKGQLAWRMNLNAIENNIFEILSEIKMNKTNIKTLFIRGELSNYILKEDYSEIKKVFSNLEIETVLNAGHWLHAENPNSFYEKVIKFICS